MIAEVAPLRRLPPQLSHFDYLVPEVWQQSIKVGSLVRVPFGRSLLPGVVLNLKNSSAEPHLKSIGSLFPLTLTYEQLKLLHYLSDF